MQQDNNIENKLRQLDDAQEPDLSNMNAHWLHMQAMLQPGAITVKKSLPKWMINILSIVVIVILVGAGLFYLSPIKKGEAVSNEQNAVAVNEKQNVDSATVQVTTDSAISKSIQSLNVAPQINRPSAPGRHNGWQEDDSLLANLKLNISPCETCPAKKSDSGSIHVNRLQMLHDLFAQLAKNEQDFIIDNRRDTLLECREGTMLLIPANSLGGKEGVVFTAKEFYRESDILLNGLSTVSNKDQLVSSGMLELEATLNGNPVKVDPSKPIRWYLPDTASKTEGMQLFDGVRKTPVTNSLKDKIETWEEGLMNNTGAANINWLPRYQYFSKKVVLTQVRVLNIIDQPFAIKEKKKGRIGYFIFDEDSLTMSKGQLKQELKNKYGYYKIRLRSSIRNLFLRKDNSDREFNSEYADRIGDSVWMDKLTADKYKLTGTAMRQFSKNETTTTYGEGSNEVYYKLIQQSGELMKKVQDKYSVDISTLGWVNCDRFYNDPGEKIRYAVNLGDSAMNYYTVLLFENIKSMMNGYAEGNKVLFANVPLGVNVKIISIGINKMGETVFSVTNATTSKMELSGLQFESTSASGLKTALSKMDQ